MDRSITACPELVEAEIPLAGLQGVSNPLFGNRYSMPIPHRGLRYAEYDKSHENTWLEGPGSAL